MTLHWTKEDDPRWDADKQRLFGPEDLAAVDLDPPSAGTPGTAGWIPSGGTPRSRSG